MSFTGQRNTESDNLAAKQEITRSGQRENIDGVDPRKVALRAIALEDAILQSPHDVEIKERGFRAGIQNDIKMNYQELLVRKSQGENVQEQLDNLRIHLASMNDSSTQRVEEARKLAVAQDIYDKKVRAATQGGETEEEFLESQMDSQSKYLRFQRQARREAGLE